MAKTYAVTIVFKGGAQVTVSANQREKEDLVDIWLRHLSDPASETEISTGYAASQGNMKLKASEVAGIFEKHD